MMELGSAVREGARRYGVFVARNPALVLGIAIVFIVIAIYLASTLVNEPMNNRDAIPQDLAVIKVFKLVSEKFPGGTSSLRVAIELNSRAGDYNVSDVRDPAVLRYTDVLYQRLGMAEDVFSTSSITSDIKAANDGVIPGSLDAVKILLEGNPQISQSTYISRDYNIIIVSIGLSEDYNTQDVYNGVGQAISDVKASKPPYVDAYQVGEAAMDAEISSVITESMGTTTLASITVIFFIMIALFSTYTQTGDTIWSKIKGFFKSFIYTIAALTAVGVGVIWAFGIAGVSGMPINEITSGAASMILGIGIDFGIQTVARFRQELIASGYSLETAMGTTLAGIFIPLMTTTSVGIIGFWAMGAGQLTIMAGLGTMMMYGIIASVIAALVVVPSILSLVEKINIWNRRRKARVVSH